MIETEGVGVIALGEVHLTFSWANVAASGSLAAPRSNLRLSEGYV